jgi:pyruvate dehydrogenase E1 component alpha subunit
MRDNGRGFIAYREGECAAGKKRPALAMCIDTWAALGPAWLMVLQEDDKPFEIRLSDEAFETYELDPPPYTLDVTKKELKQMYYDMVAVR